MFCMSHGRWSLAIQCLYYKKFICSFHHLWVWYQLGSRDRYFAWCVVSSGIIYGICVFVRVGWSWERKVMILVTRAFFLHTSILHPWCKLLGSISRKVFFFFFAFWYCLCVCLYIFYLFGELGFWFMWLF